MADQQLPDIIKQVHQLPIPEDKREQLFNAFYSDTPRAAFEAIADVPLEIKQAMFGIRGKIHRGEKYDIEDIVRAIPAPVTKAAASAETPKDSAIAEMTPEQARVESAKDRRAAAQRRAEAEIAGPPPSISIKTKEEYDFFGRPKTSKEVLVPKVIDISKGRPKQTAPPPSVPERGKEASVKPEPSAEGSAPQASAPIASKVTAPPPTMPSIPPRKAQLEEVDAPGLLTDVARGLGRGAVSVVTSAAQALTRVPGGLRDQLTGLEIGESRKRSSREEPIRYSEDGTEVAPSKKAEEAARKVSQGLRKREESLKPSAPVSGVGKFAEALGSTAPYMATGAVFGKAGTATLGALNSTEEALRRLEESGVRLTDGQRAGVVAASALLGSTEALPFERLFKSLKGAGAISKGISGKDILTSLFPSLKEYAGSSAKQFLLEGGQESVSELGQDIIETLYGGREASRIGENLKEVFTTGGEVGVFLDLLTKMAGSGAGRSRLRKAGVNPKEFRQFLEKDEAKEFTDQQAAVDEFLKGKAPAAAEAPEGEAAPEAEAAEVPTGAESAPVVATPGQPQPEVAQPEDATEEAQPPASAEPATPPASTTAPPPSADQGLVSSEAGTGVVSSSDGTFSIELPSALVGKFDSFSPDIKQDLSVFLKDIEGTDVAALSGLIENVIEDEKLLKRTQQGAGSSVGTGDSAMPGYTPYIDVLAGFVIPALKFVKQKKLSQAAATPPAATTPRAAPASTAPPPIATTPPVATTPVSTAAPPQPPAEPVQPVELSTQPPPQPVAEAVTPPLPEVAQEDQLEAPPTAPPAVPEAQAIEPTATTVAQVEPAAPLAHPKLNDSGQPVIINTPSTPTLEPTWSDPSTTAVFTPGSSTPQSLGNTEIKSWNPPQSGWSGIPGTKESLDRRKTFSEAPGKKTGAGVIIVEDDGRVWVLSPTNAFGGYNATFPKGTVDSGLTMQENAIKEAWEETGLKVDIVGVLGDYERDTSKARYYIAVRTGGSPKDMGWEAQAVSLATINDAKNLLNKQVDQKILNDLEAIMSSGKLAEIKDGTPMKISSYGPEKAPKTEGSNPGGWYGDTPGNKWLIKGNKQKVQGYVTPEQSDNRASNEILAAELIRATVPAGAPKMKLVDLEGKYGGGLGVASKVAEGLTAFDKNKTEHLSAAQKTFALHAWLANYDVLGMGYDNTFITQDGNAINIDPGGALLFRAQGLPKGASHGVTNGLLDPSAPEFESMRTTTSEQKAVFGKMTPEQLKESAQVIANITDAKIRKLVNTYGFGTDEKKAALADNLIQRRDAILAKVGLQPASSVSQVTEAPAATPPPPSVQEPQLTPSPTAQPPAQAAPQPAAPDSGYTVISDPQFSINAEVPNSVAQAFNAPPTPSGPVFDKEFFSSTVKYAIQDVYELVVSYGIEYEEAIQEKINGLGALPFLADAEKNALIQGVIPVLKDLKDDYENGLADVSASASKGHLSSKGVSFGLASDWQSAIDGQPQATATPPSSAQTSPPPTSSTTSISFPEYYINSAIVPSSVAQAINDPGFDKSNFVYGINTALYDIAYVAVGGYGGNVIENIDDNINTLEAYQVPYETKKGTLPYLKYAKEELQGKTTSEVKDFLEKAGQSFGQPVGWTDTYHWPDASSQETPAPQVVAPPVTQTATPPSPAVATQPPPPVQQSQPSQPLTGSQAAADTASVFLSGGAVSTQEIQVYGGSFSVPEFVEQSYQLQTSENQTSFKKRLQEIKDGEHTVSSLLSASESKLIGYKDKVNDGSASQFDIDRVKYLEDLLIPYLQYLNATGTEPVFISSWTNASGGYSYPSGTSMSLPAGQVLPPATWAQSLIGESLVGKDKPLKDKVEALNFYAFANEVYGKASAVTKKALRRFKTLQKTQGAIDDATIEAAKNEAASKYSPVKDAYTKADQSWASKLFKYVKEPDAFGFAWKDGSAKEKQLYNDFTQYQTNAINTKLTGPEIGVIDSYTGSLYVGLNGSLADYFISGASIDSSTSSKIKKIDSALSKIQLGYDMMLKRAVPSHYFWAQYGYAHGTHPDISDLKSWIGKAYTEVGVASTSVKPSWERCVTDNPHGKIVMKIKAGKENYGVKAYGTPISGVHNEHEVILARGTTFVIRSISERIPPDTTYGRPIWDIEVDIVDQTPAKLQ